MGYCGGTTPSPTYHDIGDYSETVQVDFDPARITYARLLERYFAEPTCGASIGLRQYRSAIFYADETQRRLADEARRQYARGRHVDVEPLRHFYLAEDYHQKYYLRQSPLASDFLRLYPNESDFVNSTAVARANAFEGGAATLENVTRDLPRMGLTPQAQDALRRLAH